MPSPLSGKRVLIVAGDRNLAALVSVAAVRFGADVEAVPSGGAALSALSRGNLHVAVVDLPLADVRAEEVFAALARASVPAIAVSGVYRGRRAAEEVRRLGAIELFEKPFAIDTLAAAVARALGVSGPALAEELPDEVTVAFPLAPEYAQCEISSVPLPALEGAPIAAAAFAPPATVPEAVRAPPGEIAPFPRGSLSAAAVPRLLVTIHEGQATGALTVSQGPARKIIAFEGGAPVYAASNLAPERFGAICVRRGVVAADRLEALRRGSPKLPTADLLLAAELLAPRQRAELVAGQIRAIVWSTLEWRTGSYELQLGRPPADRVDVRLPMGDVLLEGMLRASTLPRLREELPAGAHLAPAPNPAFELHALGLRTWEAHLLATADGTKSVDDLVRLSDVPERDTLAFLQACRVMRVLDEVERVLVSSRRIGFM